MFCWVWWYCVPRLRTDFVPCVQRSAAWCWPVPNPFGGSFGGKSARQILIRTAQINAQLWFHWEMWIPISLGSRKWKAQRTGDEILLSSKKLYENHFHTILAHCVGAVPAQPYTALSPPLWVSIHKAQLGTAQLFYGILLDGGKQQWKNEWLRVERSIVIYFFHWSHMCRIPVDNIPIKM